MKKKQNRDERRAAREKQQAQRVINYIIWALAALFIIMFISYVFWGRN